MPVPVSYSPPSSPSSLGSRKSSMCSISSAGSSSGGSTNSPSHQAVQQRMRQVGHYKNPLSNNQHQHALTIIINCCSNAFFIWYKSFVITNPLACKTEMTMIPSYIVEINQCSPTHSPPPLPWSGPGGHKTKDLFPTKRGKCLKYLFTISPERDFLHK